MKKTFICIALMSIGFASCQKEDTPTPTLPEPQFKLVHLNVDYNHTTYRYNNVQSTSVGKLVKFDSLTLNEVEIGKTLYFITPDNNIRIQFVCSLDGNIMGRVDGEMFGHGFISTSCDTVEALVNVCGVGQNIYLNYELKQN